MAGRKQFDVDLALGRAMEAFWGRGFSATSLDVLTTATGLGRGSLYGTYGGKDELFRRALVRYADHYGALYDEALAKRPEDADASIAAFFAVTLNRIGDPAVPGGCLLAQSAAEAPTLSPESRQLVRTLLDRQRTRLRTALLAGGAGSRTAEELAGLVFAVNQSLAVLSRGGAGERELRALVRTTRAAVAAALGAQ
ncbi:MAG TPA: TetR/AcrR family transcriptional regulator [Actinospica sp.]|jgi:AcrR family transcriptional regulator|nr:TetR/AcrR family transcriptional regulator [Actinospica sp.]